MDSPHGSPRRKGSVNKSGTNSCVVKKMNMAEYCTGGKIHGVDMTPSNTLIKVLYSQKAKERFDAEIAAANILAQIDPRQEDYLYALGGCHVGLNKALNEKCEIDQPELYLLEIQDGGESLATADIEFTEKEAEEILNKIVHKLQKLHSHQIIHGDFHGGNIVIDTHRNIKFIDFADLQHIEDKERFKLEKHRDLHRFSTILSAIGAKTVEGNYRTALIKTGYGFSRIKPYSIDQVLNKLNENMEGSSSESPKKKPRRHRSPSPMDLANDSPPRRKPLDLRGRVLDF